ncbi:unnamed protein product [Pleuronectes platessa]|uniref:Uncharacterized protein n=1 Tax=Pleuronectes platessa TaxID=8262 RepID=A0A9N7UNG2_PLEPL|nr:unnamed protein product [Pleuronectes platessa]
MEPSICRGGDPGGKSSLVPAGFLSKAQRLDGCETHPQAQTFRGLIHSEGCDAQPNFPPGGNRASHRGAAKTDSRILASLRIVFSLSVNGQRILILHGVLRPAVSERATQRRFGSVKSWTHLFNVSQVICLQMVFSKCAAPIVSDSA